MDSMLTNKSMKLASHNKNSPRYCTDANTWLKNVAIVQKEKLGPEEFEKLRVKHEKMRHKSEKAKKANRLYSANMVCKAAFSHNLRNISESSSGVEQQQQALTDYQQQMQVVQKTMKTVSRSNKSYSEVNDCMDEAELYAEDEELDQELESLKLALPVNSDGSLNVDDDFQKLLQAVRVEPKTDAERAVKFGLYESFLETVEKIRNETFEFWKSSKNDFGSEDSPVIKVIEKQLTQIDRIGNMGIDFDTLGGKWFVYAMCEKADRNQKDISECLRQMKTKLQLLADADGECPICLEEFNLDGVRVVTLGCCHRVCSVCWEHWHRVGTPFCPLCRHRDFVDYLASHQ